MTLVYHPKPILVADYVALLNEMDGSGYNLQEQFRDDTGDYLIFVKKRIVNTYEPRPVRKIEVLVTDLVNKALASGKLDKGMFASYGVRRIAK